MNKTSRTKLYKKFHLNPTKARPGELLEKSRHFKPRKHKRVSIGDQPSMANWRPVKGGFGFPTAGTTSGAARIQKPTAPSFNPAVPKTNASAPSLLAKSNKMCKTCGKAHAKGKHLKHKMTQRQDDAYDRKHGIKEGSKRDIEEDERNGIHDKKHKKMCKTCGKKHAKGHSHLKTHKKNWIAGAIKHPGALHRELGVKQGHKIPASTLRRAASKGGKLGRRARLAETLKGFHHKGK